MKWVKVNHRMGCPILTLRLGKVSVGYVVGLIYRDVRGEFKAVSSLPEDVRRDTFIGTEAACRAVLEEQTNSWLDRAGLSEREVG